MYVNKEPVGYIVPSGSQIVCLSAYACVCVVCVSGPTAVLPDPCPVPVDFALLPESFHPGCSPPGIYCGSKICMTSCC